MKVKTIKWRDQVIITFDQSNPKDLEEIKEYLKELRSTHYIFDYDPTKQYKLRARNESISRFKKDKTLIK